MADEINQWKDALDKAATNYASNHKDSEVRRMFGHHYRSFVDGAIWENDRKLERIKALEEALKSLEPLVDYGRIYVGQFRSIEEYSRYTKIYLECKSIIQIK